MTTRMWKYPELEEAHQSETYAEYSLQRRI